MKFARYLDENRVVEWQRAYINYRGLKKVIKRVDARYKARTSLELSRERSGSSSGAGSSRQWAKTTVEGLRKRQRKASNESAVANSEAALFENGYAECRNKLPEVTLSGTGLHLYGHEQDGSDSKHAPLAKQAETEVPVVPADVSQEPVSSSSTNDQRPRPDVEAGRPTGPVKRDGSFITFFRKGQPSDTKNRDLKEDREYLDSLNELIHSSFDTQEQMFFAALDGELDRIVTFYLERESDMTKRYEMLARQLEELAEHRREYKLLHPSSNSKNANGDLSSRLSKLVSPVAPAYHNRNDVTRKPSQKLSRAPDTENHAQISLSDPGDKRRAAALTKMLNVTGGSPSEEEDEEIRQANRLAALSYDPERYKAARKKLKVAVLEYYKGLEILKNYKILNRTGFAKILKKFEKTTQVPCSNPYYKAKITPSVLVSSDTVERLIKSTEEIYTAYFEHGNRKRALERLRIQSSGMSSPDQARLHHASTARTGFFLGITLCALVGGLVNMHHPDTQAAIPLWQSLMRVYGAEFLPIFFALLFGLNLAVWHHSRINTVFIFEWDVRHVLDYHQFFELPAFLLMLLAIAFWISFVNPFPDTIAPTTWPLVWLVVVVVIILNPFPFCYYRARRWLIVSLGRLLHGGFFSRVEFRDFFLGDELNSLNWSMSMLWFIGCEYNHRWSYPDQCDPNHTFWTAALMSIPAALRLLQCLRRYRDSHYSANLHLINAGKYTSSIMNYWLYINYRYQGSHHDKYLALWCVFATIYSLYTSSWDITMDWSLLQRRARYPFLRNELVFEHYWPVYYWAIITNVVIRFAWIIYLLPGPATNLLRIFIIALLEALRRWQWNFFRLENEHLGNVDMYRVSREVPLPYHISARPGNDDDDDDDEVPSDRPLYEPRTLMKMVRSRYGTTLRNNKGATTTASHFAERAASTASLPQSVQAKDVYKSDDRSSSINRDVSHSVASQTERGKLITHIHDILVPDRGGFAASGTRLGQMGAAKGCEGRDYQPRTFEVDGESVDSEVSGEADTDGVDKSGNEQRHY